MWNGLNSLILLKTYKMKALTESLKGIYKANQCTDLNDVNFAISALNEIIRSCYDGIHTPASRKRLVSLLNKRNTLCLK